MVLSINTWMDTRMTLFLRVLMLFLFTPLLSRSQVVDGFYALQSGNRVVLHFTMKQGNTCNGIDILHSTDSLNYSIVGSIEGVCGSASFDIPYSYIDESPRINAINYYRLDLKQLGYSDIVSLHVYDHSKRLQLFPNPATEVVRCYSSEGISGSAAITVSGIDGKVHMQSVQTENPFDLDISFLSQGSYILKYESGSTNLALPLYIQ